MKTNRCSAVEDRVPGFGKRRAIRPWMAAFGVITILFSGRLEAQELEQPIAGEEASKLPFAPSESGPHHTVWTQTNELGEVTGQYTELASGLNYWSSELNGWTPTVEGLELRQNGSAEFLKGAYHVRLASNLNDRNGSVTISFAQDRTYTFQTVGLVYTEGTTGRSVFIAELKDSVGRATGVSQWTWADAFDGVSASVQASVRAGAFQNDVVIQGQIPAPGDFGLDPAATRLEVWHQVIDGPEPVIEEQSLARKDGWVEPDARLYMADGFMMGSGTAFPVPADPATARAARSGIPVGKEWFRDAATGTRFLIEGVPYNDAREHLAALPARNEARVDRSALNKAWASLGQKRGNRVLVSSHSMRPAPISTWKTSTVPSRVRDVASVASSTPKGFLIDYSILVAATNFTFKGDVTYFITNNVSLSGLTTLEGGSITKYGTNGPILEILGTFDCRTDPWRPAIFVGRDENSLGDTISGSTGTNSGVYASAALWFHSSNNGLSIHDLRINNAATALQFSGGSGHVIQNVQCANSSYFIYVDNSILSVWNCLVADVGVTIESFNSTNRAAHLTVHNNGTLFDFSGATNTSFFYMTNSLLVNVTNTASFTSNSVVSITTNAFQTALAGAHYLLTNSPYLDYGTTNIDAGLAASLTQMTVLPPTLWSGNQTTNLTLNPTVRDPGLPALGYHYPATDHILNGLFLTNGVNLTLTNGVSVAVVATNGVTMKHGSIFRSTGRADNLNHFGGAVAVQEQPVAGTATPLLKIDAYYSSRPTVDLRFTDIAVLAGTDTRRTFLGPRLDWIGPVTLRDCLFRGAVLRAADMYPNSPYDTCATAIIGLTNNVFDRAIIEFWKTYNAASTYFTANLWQNTFVGGQFNFYFNSTLSYPYNTTCSVKDNFFDGTAIYANIYTQLTPGYNGYRSATSLGGSSNVTVTTNFTFNTGTLGRWYHGNTELVDKGSRSSTAAGMYHYTTQTSEVKEENTTVDIGFHYVKSVTGPKPSDEDDDGMPDYLEDINGNNVQDAGETDVWQPDTDFDGNFDGEEFLNGTLPLDPYSLVKVRLASWAFNSSSFVSDQGQTPSVSTGVVFDTSNWSAGAAKFGLTTSYLKYEEQRSDGRVNFIPRNGSVRFWYNPNSVTNSGLYNGTFVSMGPGGTTPDFWSFGRGYNGKLAFVTTVTNQPSGTNSTTVRYFGNGTGLDMPWDTNRWFQLVLTYTPTNVAVYLNGTNLPITSYDQRPITWTNWTNPAEYTNAACLTRPPGLYSSPNAVSRAGSGVQFGAYADGLIDQIETFNYPLSPQEVAAGFPNFWGSSLYTQDLDYDGRSDLMELYPDGTYPLVATSVGRSKLAHFRFNTTDLKGEQGQRPTLTNGFSLPNSWSGSALSIGASITNRVVYKDVETNGWANFNCRTGAVKFWFNPQWASSLGHAAPLLYMGDSANFWSFQVDSAGTVLSLVVGSSGVPTTVFTGTVTLAKDKWYHIALNYASTGCALYVNNSLVTSSSGYTNVVPESARANGLIIGNNTAGTGNCLAQFEELETFNYNLSAQEISDSYEALHRLDNNLNGVLDMAEELTLSSNVPFLDQPWAVTGVMEAEHFDKGGLGVAYGTNGVANATNGYRISKMCITNCNDIGLGYCVDMLRSNDWMKYTIDVRVAGDYAVEPRISPVDSTSLYGVFRIEFFTNGVSTAFAKATNDFTITNIGWQSMTYKRVKLPAGSNLVMKVTCLANGTNNSPAGRLNYISLYPAWDESFPSILVTNTVFASDLSTNSDYASALANAAFIQGKINTLNTSSTTGGVLMLPSGSYFVAQSTPVDTNTSFKNAAIQINRNNIKVIGQGTNNTKIISHNRATTIILVSNYDGFSISPITNTLISDIWFAGNPHSVYTVTNSIKTNYWENGALKYAWWDQGASVSYYGNFDSSPSANHLLQSCRFTSADRQVAFTYSKNIWVRSNEFFHHDGTNGYTLSISIPSSTTVTNPGASFSLAGAGSVLQNIVVTENGFNGNPNLTNYVPSNIYPAAEGLVNFQSGGNWFFARNILTNYALEGFQCNAGPAAFVQNTLSTIVGQNSTLSFQLESSQDSISNAIGDYFLSIVGNQISGGRFGIASIGNNGSISKKPSMVHVSGNSVSLLDSYESGTDFPGSAVATSWTPWLNVSGNTLANGAHGIHLVGTNSIIFALKNDFGSASYRGVAIDGSPGVGRNILLYNNVINRGLGYHFKLHDPDAWSAFLLNNTWQNPAGLVVDTPNAKVNLPQ